MKKQLIIVVAMAFAFALTTPASAQTAKIIGKTLNKSMKKTAKEDKNIPVPGLSESDSKKGTGLKLGNAVGAAVGGVLKGGTKAIGWAAQGLNPIELTKIATSGSPFSTFLSVKGKDARKSLEGAIGDQLEKTGALDMLDDVEELTGFDLPGGGKDKNKFVSAVTDNTVKVLDKKGAELMKGLKK